jgi:large subunit ribosomal protein L15
MSSNNIEMNLNELADNFGSRKKSKRLGRGIGSGKGKTSGRGGKGQTARSGVAINGFEGGQMPLYRRLPKRGFTNYTRIEYDVVSLGEIQRCVDSGLLDPNNITIEDIKKTGLVKGKSSLIKVLDGGILKDKLVLHVHAVSKSARELIESKGGGVSIVFHGKVFSEEFGIAVKQGKRTVAKKAAILKRQTLLERRQVL